MERFEHDGFTFDVTDHGPADGRVVLALHGWPEDRHCWDRLAPALVDAGCRVLAPDQRGYSPGARPPRRRDYRLDLLVGDVLALADRVGAPRVDVIGHDWGAAVAWEIAARHPERVRTLTALSVPHPEAMLTATLHGPQLLKSWYMLAFQLPWLPEHALAAGGGRMLARGLGRDGLDEHSAHRYAERAADPDAMRTMLHWYRALPFSARQRPMPAVAVPTLFVWGTDDVAITRAAAERCADHVTGPYRFVALEGQPHWLPSAATSSLAPLIVEWLADHAA